MTKIYDDFRNPCDDRDTQITPIRKLKYLVHTSINRWRHEASMQSNRIRNPCLNILLQECRFISLPLE